MSLGAIGHLTTVTTGDSPEMRSLETEECSGKDCLVSSGFLMTKEKRLWRPTIDAKTCVSAW